MGGERRRSSVATASLRRSSGYSRSMEPDEEHRRGGENGDDPEEEAKPVGEVESVHVFPGTEECDIHYTDFECGGNRFRLGDHVMMSAENECEGPYVATIKEIYQSTSTRKLMITAQWFYRPKEAKLKGRGTWERCDSRELLYSFHYDQVPASSVMHPCYVYFIPPWKQLPVRKKDPGFIVKNVYDFVEEEVYKLTDNDYHDDKQREIDHLLNKTMARLGDLPDLDEEFITPSDNEERGRRKWKRRLSHVPSHEKAGPSYENCEASHDLNREFIPPSNKEERGRRKKKRESSQVGPSHQNASRSHENPKVSKYRTILINFQALTRVDRRDYWLEKLIISLEHACSSSDNTQENKEIDRPNGSSHLLEDKLANPDRVQEQGTKGENQLIWPGSAVSAALALEKAAEETFCKVRAKNNKLRELHCALKSDVLLARLLLRQEIDPLKILKMSLADLKVELTEESTKDQHEEPQPTHIQMAKAACRRCEKRNVMVLDIYGERYQLECHDCGMAWFGSRDEAAMDPC